MELPTALPIDAILALEDATEFAIALSNLVCQRAWALGFDALTPAERVAFCVDELEREVNNGGFDQYFFNSGGDHSRAAHAALLEIGAPAMALLLADAMEQFPAPGPATDRDERQAQLDALGDDAHEAFEPLDARFFEYPDDVTALMRAYVSARRSEFRAPLAAAPSE